MKRLSAIVLDNPMVAPAGDESCYVWCKAECDYTHVYSTECQELPRGMASSPVTLELFESLVPIASKSGGSRLNLRDSVPRQLAELSGDVFFRFFLHRTRRTTATPDADSDELLAEVWLHTSFMEDGRVELPRREIDVKLKSLPTPENFTMRFEFAGERGAAAAPAVGVALGAPPAGPPALPIEPPPLPTERFYHVAPDGSKEAYCDSDCLAIATARARGRPVVRLSDVQLPNGHVLEFEVRLGTSAVSSRWTEESWMKQGACTCTVDHRMIQVNIQSENSRLVVVEAGGSAPEPEGDDFDF